MVGGLGELVLLRVATGDSFLVGGGVFVLFL